MATNLYRTLTGQSQTSEQSQQQPTSLSKVSTTEPLAGVLHHLTAQQEELLEQFRQRLQKEGWYDPTGVNGKPTHDEGTLLRFLRARKFDVNGAYGQFTDTEKWMKEQRIDELYEHFDVDLYERARTMYPQWTGHRDKRGIPVYVFVIKHLDSKNVTKYQKESQVYKSKLPNHKGLSTPAKLLPLFALYHNLLHFVMPLCSSLERPHPEVPVTASNNIVDITNVGLTQFWNLKGHMQDASVLATAHYPETLDRIFIIGAPSFFPTVWGWIKRWFDPVTVSKIFILGKHEVKPTLERFMPITTIPKKYGGQLDWEFGDLPKPDPEARAAIEEDGIKGWVPGPGLFLNHKRVIVGSEHGKLRRPDTEVAAMKPVVYAADDTEEPVHPERRLSLISAPQNLPGKPQAMTNGSVEKKHVAEAASGAALTAAAATTVASEPHHDRPATPSRQVPQEDIRKAPMADSQVYVAKQQPAHPATTAEYLSQASYAPAEPVPNHQGNAHDEKPSKHEVAPAAATTAAIGAAATPAAIEEPQLGSSGSVSSRPQSTSQPPPGMPQPGPISKHQVALSDAIAHKLQGESISVIPESANGALPHPEITIASDQSKNLALETEKLAISQHGRTNGHVARPTMERFVTAAEF